MKHITGAVTRPIRWSKNPRGETVGTNAQAVWSMSIQPAAISFKALPLIPRRSAVPIQRL